MWHTRSSHSFHFAQAWWGRCKLTPCHCFTTCLRSNLLGWRWRYVLALNKIWRWCWWWCASTSRCHIALNRRYTVYTQVLEREPQITRTYVSMDMGFLFRRQVEKRWRPSTRWCLFLSSPCHLVQFRGKSRPSVVPFWSVSVRPSGHVT